MITLQFTPDNDNDALKHVAGLEKNYLTRVDVFKSKWHAWNENGYGWSCGRKALKKR